MLSSLLAGEKTGKEQNILEGVKWMDINDVNI